MTFGLINGQEEFRSGVRRALEARSPTTEVSCLMATEAGFDREGRSKLHRELRVAAIHVQGTLRSSSFFIASCAGEPPSIVSHYFRPQRKEGALPPRPERRGFRALS